MTPQPAPLHGPVVETAGIGNRDNSLKQVHFSSPSATATFIGVRWDGDKVRGLRVELSDGTNAQAGDYDDGRYTLTTYRFAAGEKLSKAWLRDSGYGYRSLREVEFATSTGHHFMAGAGGFDNEASLAVDGASLVGFHAWVNPDNFISGLTLMVRHDTPPPPVVQKPWFETKPIGNTAAGGTQVQSASTVSTALSLAVRWDGDKVRGLRLVLNDGTTTSAGGIDDTSYTLTSYTFTADETLQTLSYSSSGYGYGSLRRLEFTTSKGGKFAAGPAGIDDVLTPPVAGARIAGLHAWVNQDNFINALAFRLTDDAPYSVKVSNHSPWTVAYANGTVTVNGKAAIHVSDEGTNKHGKSLTHNRVLGITSGLLTGYCAYDGNTQLTISVFADATFEAKFGVDYGDGTVYGPIYGVSPSTAKPALIDGLARKYAPIFMLNADEVYWPSNVDSFLTHMILQRVTAGIPSDFYTGPLNRATLAAEAARLGPNNTNDGAALRTAADLNQASDTQDWFNGTRPVDGSQVTSYAVFVEGANGRASIVYWWFFNYNQGKNVASTSWGNHVSDWEHVRVELANVDFNHPQNETLLFVMFDHHGDQETHAPGDPAAEFSGRQVLVHLANGDHEAYPKVGIYDRPQNTHDYCKDNAYRFDQREGNVEVYLWGGAGFLPVPAGAPASFKDPAWTSYRGRWGNWERGSLFGQVAELESGPEGIFRPGEYPVPQ
ncbi:MAG TPA: Vps62-related protein [Bryobacteraceae bacterium]|jgi:hypothetical protein|nr:Vps62-related protein [Bryobacteraceae bacterium]